MLYSFHAPSSEESEKWYKQLGNFCVRTNFQKEYKVMNIIGEGSFSIVYEAYMVRKFKRVAVKCVRKGLLHSNKALSV